MPPSLPVEMELRDVMQQIALEFPAYGYRRITSELNRRGFAVHHKRVLRLMQFAGGLNKSVSAGRKMDLPHFWCSSGCHCVIRQDPRAQ